MKVIIAGTRSWTASKNAISDAVEASGFRVSEVVSGGAKGIDKSGEIWAKCYQYIPVTVFRADWDQYGKKAGPLRNREMAAYADALIVFWDGKSRGTLSMINEMRRLKKPYYVVPLGNVKLVDLHKKEKPPSGKT